jgi:acyl carrier protein
MSDIFDKLIPIFRNVFDDDELIINETTKAEDIDEWDSLAHIRLVISISSAFVVSLIINSSSSKTFLKIGISLSNMSDICNL